MQLVGYRTLLATILALSTAAAVMTAPGVATAETAAPRGDTPSVGPGQSANLKALAAPGPFDTCRFVVDRGALAVEVGLPERAEDLAEITVPCGKGTNARKLGKLPVVLLLHGRHRSCYVSSTESAPMTWPCEPGSQPIPSYQGYRYMADLLASQGYLVSSVSANGINGQDGSVLDGGAEARARLVDYQLTRLIRAGKRSTPGYGSRLVGRVDKQRVMLMGHSRGGEGIVRAANRAVAQKRPYQIRGLYPLAPVAFGLMAPAGVATMTLLPACDGDVSDLQGQQYVDRSVNTDSGQRALRSAVWVPRTNHNFYNTQWTPGLSVAPSNDDAEGRYSESDDDGQCADGKRLNPSQTQVIGRSYAAALAALSLREDPRAIAVLDGSGKQLPQTRAFGVQVTAVGGTSRLLARVSPANVRSAGVQASVCQGATKDFSPACGETIQDLPDDGRPHWIASSATGTDPAPNALRMAWSTPGGFAATKLTRAARLSPKDAIVSRVILDPNSSGRLSMVVFDRAGRKATVPLPNVKPLTRGSNATKLWAQTAAVKVSRLRGINLDKVTSIGIAPRSGAGQAWLLDTSVRSSRYVSSGHTLPEISIAPLSVDVAPGQVLTSHLTVTVSGKRRGPALATLVVNSNRRDRIPPINQVVRIPANRSSVQVPITFDGTGPDVAAAGRATLIPISGATAGSWKAKVLADTPSGVYRFTVDEPSAIAPPGGTLAWRLRPSSIAPHDIDVELEIVDAAMMGSDLAESFREQYGIDPSEPLVESSASGIRFNVTIPAGQPYADFEIPLSPEASELAHLLMQVGWSDGGVPADDVYFDGLVSQQ